MFWMYIYEQYEQYTKIQIHTQYRKLCVHRALPAFRKTLPQHPLWWCIHWNTHTQTQSAIEWKWYFLFIFRCCCIRMACAFLARKKEWELFSLAKRHTSHRTYMPQPPIIYKQFVGVSECVSAAVWKWVCVPSAYLRSVVYVYLFYLSLRPCRRFSTPRLSLPRATSNPLHLNMGRSRPSVCVCIIQYYNMHIRHFEKKNIKIIISHWYLHIVSF